MQRFILAITLTLLCSASVLSTTPQQLATRLGDAMIGDYFQSRVMAIEASAPSSPKDLAEWKRRVPQLRSQLKEMLGLKPWPDKTPLMAVTTSAAEEGEIVVEQVHFQSRPGLYVTGNLYRPKVVNKRLPAILYVCGHGGVKENGISYGNKVHYQHHGAWFAKNGYVCLTIDTLQLGEIEGIHHGLYRHDMWWWMNRGYTPAGVEAWNCVRAIDYLQSRVEVDPERIGVTGRSGGGAYSWWIAAIDERIKVAVPVAGITDLRNHVIDGCVEGHCDCMFMVNTYQWDYATVAALVAPRPLLISNTDSDGIFPLDGVVRTFEKVRNIYRLYGAADQVALNITAGPHKDTQELRVHAFRWLNYHLKDGDTSLIETTAVPEFTAQQLRVFQAIPENQSNTTIHESFVSKANIAIPDSAAGFQEQADSWRQSLDQKVFRAWPKTGTDVEHRLVSDTRARQIRLRVFEFDSQPHIKLRLYCLQKEGIQAPSLTTLHLLDEPGWSEFAGKLQVDFGKAVADEVPSEPDDEGFSKLRNALLRSTHGIAFLAPRGIGPTAWDPSPKKQIQIRRRFYLLGETLDGMRAWDARCAINTLHTIMPDVHLRLNSARRMAGVALAAVVYEPTVEQIDLYEFPKNREEGPFLLNLSRVIDLQQLMAMAARNTKVILFDDDPKRWPVTLAIEKVLDQPAGQFQVLPPPATTDQTPSEK